MSLCRQQVSFKWTKKPIRMGAHKNFVRERHGGLKGMASAEHEPITDLFNFWKISDNISKTVRDSLIVSIKFQ